MQAAHFSLPRVLLSLGFLALMAPISMAEEECPNAPQPAARFVEFSLSGLSVEEPPPSNPFGPTLHNFRSSLGLLDQLAADPEVDGLLLKTGASLDFARSIDVLEALTRVKKAGKHIACYAESLDRSALLYASVADLLMVPPSGMVVLEGLSAEVLYIKQLLQRLHASVEVLHVGDFKTAFEDFSRDHMSEPQRVSLQAVLSEYYQQLVGTIARNRGLQTEQVEVAFGEIFLSPEKALAAGLIDAVGYEDEFDSKLEAKAGGAVKRVDDYGDESQQDLEEMLANPLALFSMLPKLMEPPKKELPPGPKIAIVYASGPINSGRSAQSFDGAMTMGSDTIVEALEETIEDDDIKAVILRVNSPGGSALASDMIYRAVMRVREHKPVVASMGSVAASGGYWISMGCNKIVAQPSTLTGSIGVVSAVPNLSESLKKLGVTVEVVGAGPHVEELSLLRNGPSDLLKTKIMEMMEQTYEDFVHKVAQDRPRLGVDQVHEYAKGRVWTGRMAYELGLVDGIGGLQDAVVMACYLAGGGLDADTIPVLELPERPSIFEQLEEMMGGLAEHSTQVEWALRLTGFEEALPVVEFLLQDRPALHADRVLAILPMVYRIR
jgi:protease-4